MSKVVVEDKNKPKTTEGASAGDTGHGTVTSAFDIESKNKAQLGEPEGSGGPGFTTQSTGQRVCRRCGEVFLSDGDATAHVKRAHPTQAEIEARVKEETEKANAKKETK